MGAFADWMANKLEGRAGRQSGAYDIPEEERDPLTQNAYWTPADERAASSDGGALDQAMAVLSSPITMAKGAWEGAKDVIPFTRESLSRVPETDADLKKSALRGFNAVGTAALGSGPMGALTAQARRAAIPGAFTDIPFDLPVGPRQPIDFTPYTPTVQTKPGELFDYSGMQGIAPDNPLKLKSPGYYNPPRGLNENSQALLADKKISRGLSSAFDRGVRNSGEVPLDWYNMEPLRQRFGEMYQGPMNPNDAFLQFNDAIAASSVMNPVDQNMRNASQIYQLLQQGKEIPRTTDLMPTFAGPGGQTRLIVNRKLFGQEPGWDPWQSPKVDNFRRNLSGDQSTVTVDSHASRAPGMFSKDPRFLEGRVRTGDESGTGYTSFSPREMLEGGQVTMKDLMDQPTWWQSRPRKSEYGAFAKLYERLADRKGVSPAQAQAAAWYGNADMTGVVTPPKTALQILEDVVNRNADRSGISNEKMLSDVINGRSALYANQARAAAPAVLANQGSLQAREVIPYAGSGHLSGAADLPYDVKLDYTKGSPFATMMDPMQTGPTMHGAGAYKRPDGGIETNPVMTTPYSLGAEDLNALQGYHNTMGVQGGTPTSSRGVVPDTYPASWVEAQTQGPVSVEQMQRLGSEPPGGAFAVVDDSSRGGVRFLGDSLDTAAIQERMRSEGIPATYSEGAGSSVYNAYEPFWDKSTPGSGVVTRRFLEDFDAATPGTQRAINGPDMRITPALQNLKDRGLAERYGLTTRDDVMRMRSIFYRDGVDGLRAALARGEALPSNADIAAIAAVLSDHQED
jgi:hypothetical protein